MEADLKVEGVEPILARMRKLRDRPGRNALRRALRQGANQIKNLARQKAKLLDDPDSTEKIWKNINVSAGGSKRERRAKAIVMRVGVMGGANPRSPGDYSGLPGGDTRYWRLVEFGTSRTEAKPFMRKAAAEGSQAAINAFIENALPQLDKEI